MGVRPGSSPPDVARAAFHLQSFARTAPLFVALQIELPRRPIHYLRTPAPPPRRPPLFQRHPAPVRRVVRHSRARSATVPSPSRKPDHRHNQAHSTVRPEPRYPAMLRRPNPVLGPSAAGKKRVLRGSSRSARHSLRPSHSASRRPAAASVWRNEIGSWPCLCHTRPASRKNSLAQTRRGRPSCRPTDKRTESKTRDRRQRDRNHDS